MNTSEKLSHKTRRKPKPLDESEMIAIYDMITKEGKTQDYACKHFGVTNSLFSRWKFKKYPDTPKPNKKSWKLSDYLKVLEMVELGFSQREACSEVGIPQSTFSYWFTKYRKKNGYRKERDAI